MPKHSTAQVNLWLTTVQVLLLATLYFIAGQASFLLFVSHRIVSPIVFTSEGFALAAVILLGKRLSLGVFLGQLVLALYNGLAWHTALGVSLVNGIDAVIGAILFQRLALQPSFERMRDVLGLLGLSFFVLQPFSATLNNLLLWLDGTIPTPQLGIAWFSWWFSNSFGQVLIASLLLAFFTDKKPVKQKLRGISWLGMLFVPISIIILFDISPNTLSVAFILTIPVLILIAAKSNLVTVNLAIIILTIITLFFSKQQISQSLLSGNISLLLDLNGNLLSILLTGQFISALLSEYNRVRLAQEKTAEQLQKITNNIPGLIYQFRLNLDGSYCFPYANQGMESVYGVSAEQAQENANTIFDLIHPDDYGGLVASITDSAQHLSPWQYIYRVYHKDGTMRWLSGHSIPQREADGAILWHGFIRDISEFKHKEIEYQTVIEASINGFWSNDFSGCFLTVNSALCNILGYSEQELLNMTVMDIEAAENTEETATHFQKIIQTGHDTFETRHQRKDARIIDVEVNVLYVESLGQRFFVFINDITERKQSQKALATSEEKYRTLFDSIQDGIVYVDMQGTILECNQCYSDMLGYSEEELKKITFHQVTPEKWYALEAEMIEKEVINRGYCDLFEKEYIRKDGTVFPIELRAWLAKDKNGHNQGMWAIIRDITKRKLVERYLQKNQALLQTAQRAARMGHYVADLRTPNTMTWTNDTLLDEIYGVDQQFPHTLLNWKSLIHPDDLEEVMQIFQELFTNHSRFPDKNSMDSISYRIIRPNDGETRWTETWAYNFYDDNGVIFQQVGMVQDITERKLAEIDLRIAATVFEAQEGMMIADAHCIILNVNHAFTLITGYSASESIGKTPHFLQSGRHDKAFYDALWQSIYDTGAWQGEIWDRRKNGEIFPQWLTITAVKDKNGTVVSHYVSTLTDITERKATEETINRLAFYDPLTHLPNRRLLQERLKHGIEISHRTGSLMAVIMMDLDRFKAVNDSLGHAAGDALLQQVAERIKNRLREVDMVARLGGDEFVIVIDAVEQCSDVERVAEAIIHTLSQPFVLYEIHQVSIGTSIGIALHPQHGDSPEILLDNADMALYHAKNQGRGCFAHFSDALRKK